MVRDTAAVRRDTTRAPRDTVRQPSDTAAAPGRAVPLPSDTLADTAKQVPRDTIKAPLARAPLPPLEGVGAQYHWNRDSLFASGVGNLLDLLARIPGVTALRSGWIGSPQYAAYLGNPARVRVFYDGVEIDPLDPRSGGALDLTAIQVWTLEEVAVERGADELRVYLRSWRVARTTTNTRIDVLTGDQQTNVYRGFYGKRYGNGMAFQLGGQQYETSSDPSVGGGDELALLGRLGWAKGRWSLDAFAVHSSRTRDRQDARLAGATNGVAAQERTRTDGYVRGGFGDPESGPWVQLMVASEKFDEHTPFSPGVSFAAPDSADTTRSVTQYVAAAGLTRGRLRVSATERFHSFEDRTLNSLSGRVAYDRPLVGLSLYADYRGGDTTSTEEAALRLSPLSFLTITGAVTRRHGGGVDGGDRIATRGEVGLRVRDRLWLSGGVLRRNAAQVPGLIAYDTSYRRTRTGLATGFFGTARGKFYEDLGVDAVVVRWDAPGFYRPQLQTREELYLDTRWLSRFPSGNFGFFGSVAHEYRQNVLFPTTGSDEANGTSPAVALYSHTLTTRLEIRIVDAVLFWHATYGIRPTPFEYVPGLLQPRQRFVYGVRWNFWN